MALLWLQQRGFHVVLVGVGGFPHSMLAMQFPFSGDQLLGACVPKTAHTASPFGSQVRTLAMKCGKKKKQCRSDCCPVHLHGNLIMMLVWQQHLMFSNHQDILYLKLDQVFKDCLLCHFLMLAQVSDMHYRNKVYLQLFTGVVASLLVSIIFIY